MPASNNLNVIGLTGMSFSTDYTTIVDNAVSDNPNYDIDFSNAIEPSQPLMKEMASAIYTHNNIDMTNDLPSAEFDDVRSMIEQKISNLFNHLKDVTSKSSQQEDVAQIIEEAREESKEISETVQQRIEVYKEEHQQQFSGSQSDKDAAWSHLDSEMKQPKK
jgi:hypothetical protein